MKKILLIENDIIIVKIISFLLKKEGYEIHVAIDGNEGLEKFKTIHPDLIISDILLPYKSGLEITDFVKKTNPSIPIILVSALGREDQTIIEAFKLGADDFLSKPFKPTELISSVQRFMQIIPDTIQLSTI